MYNRRELKVSEPAKKPAKPKDVDYISKMGYRDDSPFRDRASIDIHTPNGIIDMSNTGIPIMANSVYLPPYSGQHQFDTNIVTETKMVRGGGITSEKALQFIKDGSVQGNILTQNQLDYFSELAGVELDENGNIIVETDDEEMRYGGLKKRKRNTTNPAVGINDLMLRNPQYHTAKGKHFTPPKQGGWLDKYQPGGGTVADMKNKIRLANQPITGNTYADSLNANNLSLQALKAVGATTKNLTQVKGNKELEAYVATNYKNQINKPTAFTTQDYFIPYYEKPKKQTISSIKETVKPTQAPVAWQPKPVKPTGPTKYQTQSGAGVPYYFVDKQPTTKEYYDSSKATRINRETGLAYAEGGETGINTPSPSNTNDATHQYFTDPNEFMMAQKKYKDSMDVHLQYKNKVQPKYDMVFPKDKEKERLEKEKLENEATKLFHSSRNVFDMLYNQQRDKYGIKRTGDKVDQSPENKEKIKLHGDAMMKAAKDQYKKWEKDFQYKEKTNKIYDRTTYLDSFREPSVKLNDYYFTEKDKNFEVKGMKPVSWDKSDQGGYSYGYDTHNDPTYGTSRTRDTESDTGTRYEDVRYSPQFKKPSWVPYLVAPDVQQTQKQTDSAKPIAYAPQVTKDLKNGVYETRTHKGWVSPSGNTEYRYTDPSGKASFLSKEQFEKESKGKPVGTYKMGGWLDQYQPGGQTTAKNYYPTSPEDYTKRKQMYNDSLAIANPGIDLLRKARSKEVNGMIPSVAWAPISDEYGKVDISKPYARLTAANRKEPVGKYNDIHASDPTGIYAGSYGITTYKKPTQKVYPYQAPAPIINNTPIEQVQVKENKWGNMPYENTSYLLPESKPATVAKPTQKPAVIKRGNVKYQTSGGGKNYYNVNGNWVSQEDYNNSKSTEINRTTGMPIKQMGGMQKFQPGGVKNKYITSEYKPKTIEEAIFRNKMYSDSLNLADQSRKQQWFFPKNQQLTKPEYDSLSVLENSYPQYFFQQTAYDKDKKNNKVESFKDYIQEYRKVNDASTYGAMAPVNKAKSITGKDLSEAEKEDMNEYDELSKKYDKTWIDKSGKEHSYVSAGTPNDGLEYIYDPQTGTTKIYSIYDKQKMLYAIENNNIKPNEAVYKGSKNKVKNSEISTSSSNTGWYDTTKPKPKFKTTSNESYISYDHNLEKHDLYPYPTQKILKTDKDAPKGEYIDYKKYYNIDNKPVNKQPIKQTESAYQPSKGPVKYSTTDNTGQKYYFVNNQPVQEFEYKTYYKNVPEIDRSTGIPIGQQPVTKKQMGGEGWLEQYQPGGPKIDRSLMGVVSNPSETTQSQAPMSKYAAAEQNKAAVKAAIEGHAETAYNKHLQREELKKKYPTKNQEEIQRIQDKIESPLFYEPAGQLASYATRFHGLTDDEIASITGSGTMGDRLGVAANMAAWALANEVGGKAIGNFVKNTSPYIKQGLGYVDGKLAKYIPKELPGSSNAPKGAFNNLQKPTIEQFKDAQGFLKRREFIKQLQNNKLLGKDFQDLNHAARSTDKTNALTKLALDRDATRFRGVEGSVPKDGIGYQEYTGQQYNMSEPRWGQTMSEFDNMKNAGIDFNDPISIAKYQATHIPMQNYGYRSGMPEISGVDALYAGRIPTGYGKYQIKMTSPRDYNQGNYQDWFNKYYNPKNNLRDLATKGGYYIRDWKPNSSYEMPIGLSRTDLTTTVGNRGQKMFDVDESFPFMDYKNLTNEQSLEFNNYIKNLVNDYNTGWRGKYKTGGGLNKYQVAGQVPRIDPSLMGTPNFASETIRIPESLKEDPFVKAKRIADYNNKKNAEKKALAEKYYNERKNQKMIGVKGTPEELDKINKDVSEYSASNNVDNSRIPLSERVGDFATDMALNLIGTGAYTSLGKGVSALAKEEQVASGVSKFIPKKLPRSPNASSLLEKQGVKTKSNIIKENIQDGSFKISSRSTPNKGLVNVNVKSPTGSIQANINPDGSYGLSFEDANPFNAGKSMLKLKDQLAGKTIYETKSFSTDSYANVLNLKKKLPFEEAGFVPLNSSNKANNFLDDLVTKNSKEWSASANFKSEEAAIEGAKRMDNYMLKLGETTKSKVVNNNGKFEVHVPNYKIKVPEVNTTFKKLPGSPNSLEGLGYNPVKSGFGNPLAIADALIPMPSPQQAITLGYPLGSRMSLSPMNIVPGYGKIMKGKGEAFRKFGNSMDDIIERQLFGPSGGSKFRIGKNQIVNEGNWANAENFDEAYSGVFGAKVNPKVEGTNLSYSGMSNRNGVLIKDKAGNLLPDIPIEDPGLTFHRRLPFSNRYVPINKQKLIDKKFQLATQLPYVQSLGEKYVTGLGIAAGVGAFGAPGGAQEMIDTYNKYTGVTEAKKKIKGWLDKYK